MYKLCSKNNIFFEFSRTFEYLLTIYFSEPKQDILDGLFFNQLELNMNTGASKCSHRRRDKKMSLKQPHLSQKLSENRFNEDRLRKTSKRFINPTRYFEEVKTTSKDVIGHVRKETLIDQSVVSPAQIRFEKRVLELLSKCRDFCPKVYNKLENMASKKMSYDCSRIKIGTTSDPSEQGKYFSFVPVD